MFDKRLLSLVPAAAKFIAADVVFQWIGLLANIALFLLVGSFMQGLVAGTADAEAAAGADALLRALRPEATRLFVGAPEPACPPYEGVWAAEADGVQPLLFVNPRSMEVERFMRSCGLGRPEGTNEPLDHVATECELLERLALRAAGAPASEGAPDGAGLPGGSPAAAYETFLSGHAQAWMPAFAERLAAEARHPFYRAAAAYLGALLADWPSEA